jgi:protein-S-isoprenylcysteine O-methyltransferase Ste14
VVANLSAFGLFFPSLLIFSGSSEASMAQPRAPSGCVLALAGAAFVLRSRAELGPAWSFAPKADEGIGLVTTGPIASCATPSTLAWYRFLWAKRSLSAAGSPVMILLVGIVPTFAWRAGAEEKLLSRTFGEGYAIYRQRTKMIIPHLL